MKKREIETYMDAFMEGFWQCYDMMMDMIEDDEPDQPSQEIVEDSRETKRDLRETKDAPEVETSANSSKPKNAQKIDRGKVCALLDAGWKVPKIAGEMKVSEASIYNIQKEHREEKAKQAGELK